MAGKVPLHVGYILDGNRRWARSHKLAVWRGHEKGQNVLHEIVQATFGAGVKYVSVYAFSTENWSRSNVEVKYLMQGVVAALEQYMPEFIESGVSIRFLGREEGLPLEVVQVIREAESKTASNTKAVLGVCLNYGGHAEVVDAIKKIVQAGTKPEKITPDLIATQLYVPEIPPCDVIVRTSGEKRLSGFMLWRSAYSELVFIDKNWPEMTKDDVDAILKEYNRRNRRFGG